MKSISKTYAAFIAMILIGATITGCGAVGFLGNILGSNRVTVRLVNNSDDFDVDVQVRYGDENLETKDLIKVLGEEVNRSLSPGEQAEFTRDCDELESIFIDEAELQAPLISPKEDTDVIVDGDNFSCGDTIVYTFSHSDILIDFDISTSIQ
ncbi:MAG: hypothetical protein DHS20C16_16090 [Phycisphaerae bacterium]|nr:MAG: hypothetical protein DHS20C16_16090 [Phycisphaerae bacterium]